MIQPIYLINTLSKKKEPLVCDNQEQVKIYSCGPTVYNSIHIGNCRVIIVTDLLIRVLTTICKKEVIYLSNITDLSEKIFNLAKISNFRDSEKEIAAKYTKKYLSIIERLNIVKPNEIILSTTVVEDIKISIKKLLQANKAYQTQNGVYFDISCLADYGILSNMNLDKNIYQESKDNKKQSADFALWKFKNEGLLFNFLNKSGIPGWHSECVEIINKQFNSSKHIDIHIGGKDLIFPHNENELAIHKALYGNDLSNIWLNIGQLQYKNQKMSKSIGNIITVKDFLSKYNLNVLRYCLLNNNYHRPFNLTDQVIHEAIVKTNKFVTTVSTYKKTFKPTEIIVKKNIYINEMQTFLLDNLNTANVFRLINNNTKKINVAVRNNANNEDILTRYQSLLWIFDILGFVI